MAVGKLQTATRDVQRMKLVVRNQRKRVANLKSEGSANAAAQAAGLLEVLEEITNRCLDRVMIVAGRDVPLPGWHVSGAGNEGRREGVGLSEEELLAAALEFAERGFDPAALYDVGGGNGVRLRPRASALH